ncbi:MAG: sulfatase [Candidatus Hodarchaeota archaeon]
MKTNNSGKPNILFIMTDQQRFDTIAALGNKHIFTPNLDRLVKRGMHFSNAYSPCPVCVPARYTIRTGCESPTLRIFSNSISPPVNGQKRTIEERCGPYLAKTMQSLGYRTFGVGKFHSSPWSEDLGYEVHLHSEELYGTPAQREGDAYASWLHEEHPEFDYLEGLMGERTEMYYMPQMSVQPADCAVESWAADRAIEQMTASDQRPFFGMVSFIGPHPPFAPPIPFNRMYNPDQMPNPVKGNLETDHMDQQIPWMNDIIWAESINNPHARVLKARYYGEISYIDSCLGKILDYLETREDADNTLICFFSDHGDHLGDHHAWQKESFFDATARIPFLVSWPSQLPQDQQRTELVCLTDLFSIATGAAGKVEVREGIDFFGMIEGTVEPRKVLFGYYGVPGSKKFKIMVRDSRWKYIFFANGGKEQLFDLIKDPDEICNLAGKERAIAQSLRKKAVAACDRFGIRDALNGNDFKILPLWKWEWKGERIYQFDRSKGIHGFAESPLDIHTIFSAQGIYSVDDDGIACIETSYGAAGLKFTIPLGEILEDFIGKLFEVTINEKKEFKGNLEVNDELNILISGNDITPELSDAGIVNGDLITLRVLQYEKKNHLTLFIKKNEIKDNLE